MAIHTKVPKFTIKVKHKKDKEYIFPPYNPNNSFGLKEHQIVSCPGKGGKIEYGVIVNVDNYTVRWDTNRPSDFETGACALGPLGLKEIEEYEFKYINQDGTWPKKK